MSRLKDAADHFPYKRDAAERAGIPPDIVGATDAYISAQADVLAKQTPETRTAYRDAKLALVEARREHRVGRVLLELSTDGDDDGEEEAD